MSSPLPVLDDAAIAALLAEVDSAGALRRMFASLHAGEAVQPPQTLVEFPGTPGDFITYSGVLEPARLFGVKLSPYIARSGAPLVTAWTLVMSLETGAPLMLCDAKRLTTERTAATTALAVDLLAGPQDEHLAIIGTGEIALAHLRHVRALRPWSRITVASRRTATQAPTEFERFTRLDPAVRICRTVDEAVAGASVILLCTSSGTPVVDPGSLSGPALITSISTNVARAHEIPPQSLPDLDVFCDYRATAPLSAGEMVIARERHGWSAEAIVADLPELVSGKAPPPATGRHRFFRSIGLGLEDIAMAAEIHRVLTGAQKDN